MFGELSEAREDAGSPSADSKRLDTGAERQVADKIGGGELRREPGEKARGGERRLDIEQYVVKSEGGRGRTEGVGRCESEKVKMEKRPPATQEDGGNPRVGGETSDVGRGF